MDKYVLQFKRDGVWHDYIDIDGKPVTISNMTHGMVLKVAMENELPEVKFRIKEIKP